MKLAARVDSLRSSATRAMLSIARVPEMSSFAGGLPAPESFPVEAFLKASQELLVADGKNALQYGPAEGHMPLREKIAQRMKKSQVEATAENVIITSGSQQGLEFTAKLFIDPGDVIICESPTYLGAITAFNSYQIGRAHV